MEAAIVQTLKESELRYRRLFEAAQDGILILDAETGMIDDVNPYLINMLGYSRPELIKKKLWEVGAFKDISASQDAFAVLQENEYIRYEDLPLRAKDGRLVQVEFVSNVYLVGSKKVIQCQIRDFTEHRRAEDARRKNDARFRRLVEQLPTVIYTNAVDDASTPLYISPHIQALLGYTPEEWLADPKLWSKSLHPEDSQRVLAQAVKSVQNYKPFDMEYRLVARDGRLVWVHDQFILVTDLEGQPSFWQGIMLDVTEHKKAESALHESEERYRLLMETLPDGVIVHSQGRIVFANQASAKIVGAASPAELIGMPVIEFVHPDYREMALKRIEQMMNDGIAAPLNEEKFLRMDGTSVDMKVSANPFSYAGKPSLLTVFADITERKQAEKALRQSEADYRALFENSIMGISQALPDGSLLRANAALAQMYGFANPEEMMAEVTNVGRLYANPEDREEVQRVLAAKGIMEPREMAVVRRNGTRFTVLMGMREIRDSEGNLRCNQGVHVDISTRKLTEERIRQQLARLTALSTIDHVIAANFDLKLSFSEILTHVTIELDVDAADILIFNANSLMLEFGAERGFHTTAIRKAQVRLGENYAGRVALERKLVQIPNLREEPGESILTTGLAGEDFACYYGVPLIAKGQVKGVLEIFNRSVLEPDAEWLAYLNSLAEQTAIAIDNSTLFESLQQSNLELTLAYDATIEGWSRALDLRDKETEGHTQRVTALSVKLASSFGLSEAELVQVRWGALLHDIGKLGVPDGILLKPGPLTDEEWVRMRMHPTFAYEMLAPIRYLRLALDIPYCHHEKWDGTGYPRGLKGTQIPLVARIFALVDMWDALTSDRPYRAAWTKEKAREYILSESGTHLDAQVVEVFMGTLN